MILSFARLSSTYHSTFSKFVAGLVAAVVILAGTVNPSSAQVAMDDPVYNEATKSYFTLVKVGPIEKLGSPSRSWDEMNGIAMGMNYKGVRGRLAKVDSKQVHDLLREHFASKIKTRAWIGLRYFCNYSALMWNDGTRLNRSDFQIWSPTWNQGTDVQCGGPAGYYPAYYREPKEGFLWALTGSKKHYNEMFVEFVTDGE